MLPVPKSPACPCCKGWGEMPIHGRDDVGLPGSDFYGVVGTEACEACAGSGYAPQADEAA